tara:strand:+ start:801 stop:1922 length:1122 start_codon:yes stop_codon:yes gene_type:complete
MAYQDITAAPRFYINGLEWLDILGYSSVPSNHYRTLPVKPSRYQWIDANNNQVYNASYNYQAFTSQSFVAILGHNAGNEGGGFQVNYDSNENNYTTSDEGVQRYFIQESPIFSIDVNSASLTEVVNLTYKENYTQQEDPSANLYMPDYDGFSIATFDGRMAGTTDNHPSWLLTTYEINQIDIGSVIMGSYFQMQNSPDLSLTMSIEYGGINKIESKGGSLFTNYDWVSKPKWGNLPSWEIGNGYTFDSSNLLQGRFSPEVESADLSRSGRRVWKLDFSYMNNSNIFPDVTSLSAMKSIYEDDSTDKTLLDDNNFFSQVIHRTNGGQIPFIFQPDSSNNSPDMFAIAIIDQDSFNLEQVANGVYNISLKIREVW